MKHDKKQGRGGGIRDICSCDHLQFIERKRERERAGIFFFMYRSRAGALSRQNGVSYSSYTKCIMERSCCRRRGNSKRMDLFTLDFHAELRSNLARTKGCAGGGGNGPSAGYCVT